MGKVMRDKLINKMAEAMANVLAISPEHAENAAESALDALLGELPNWHELHKNDKSKHPLNTMAAISVSYQELLDLRK